MERVAHILQNGHLAFGLNLDHLAQVALFVRWESGHSALSDSLERQL
jgi:hypothetical protein